MIFCHLEWKKIQNFTSGKWFGSSVWRNDKFISPFWIKATFSYTLLGVLVFSLFLLAINEVNSFILFTQKAPNGWKVFMAISLIGLVYPCKKKKISIWGKEFWADHRLFWTYATICLQDKANFCYKWTNPGRYVSKIFVKLHMRFFHKLPSNSEFATSF